MVLKVSEDRKKSVVVMWRCIAPKSDGVSRFDKIIKCSKQAVFSKEFGWLCDCGRWTTGSDDYHEPLKQGVRNICDCSELVKDVNVDGIVGSAVLSCKLYLKDETVCSFCDIPGCPGPVRFQKEYYDDIGIPVCNETSLPMCPHAVPRVVSK
jgi:hypothetical protein